MNFIHKLLVKEDFLSTVDKINFINDESIQYFQIVKNFSNKVLLTFDDSAKYYFPREVSDAFVILRLYYQQLSNLYENAVKLYKENPEILSKYKLEYSTIVSKFNKLECGIWAIEINILNSKDYKQNPTFLKMLEYIDSMKVRRMISHESISSKNSQTIDYEPLKTLLN